MSRTSGRLTSSSTRQEGLTMMVKMVMVMLKRTQVKEARVPTLILDPVSVRLYDDSKVAELNFAKNDDVRVVFLSCKIATPPDFLVEEDELRRGLPYEVQPLPL